MKKAKTLWVPALLGMLLLAILVGVAGARPDARPQQQAWRVLSVAPGACLAAVGNTDWVNAGYELHCSDAVACLWHCPLDFPAAGEQAVGAVHIKRFTMYAFDNNATPNTNVSAYLSKMYPPTHKDVTMAHFATSGGEPTDPQVLVDTTIQHNPVYRTQAPYISIVGSNSTSVKVYGFFVHYTW
jgi:hypothetical protein